MRKTLLYILLLLLPAVSLRAQEEDTYLMEVGAGGGMMGYLGDFNSTITKDLQPMASLLWRYNLSPYMGVRANVSYGKMKGSSADVKDYYPNLAGKPPYEFNNTLIDVGFTYEYNF